MDTTTALELVFGALVVAVAASVVAGRPQLAVPLVATVSIAAFSGFAPVLLSISGLNVFAMDAVTAVLLGALLIQMGAGRQFNSASAVWFALGALAVIALLRGINRFGVEAAFQSLRPTIQFLSVAIFFACQVRDTPKVLEFIRATWLVASVALGVVALLFLLRFGLNRFGAEVDRPLSAPQALIVLQALLMELHARGRRMVPTVTALGLLIVLSQQRTVWIGAVVALFLYWFLLATDGRQKRNLTRAAVVSAGLFAILLVAFPSSTLGTAAQRAVTEPFNSRNTFIWRVAGWDILISQQVNGPLADLLVGNPSGTGSARRLPSALGGGLVEVSAHSQWVTELLMGGVAAVALFALAAVAPTVRSWLLDRARHRPSQLTTVAVAALVFTTSYQLYPEQGVVFGTLGAIVVLARRDRAQSARQLAHSPNAR